MVAHQGACTLVFLLPVRAQILRVVNVREGCLASGPSRRVIDDAGRENYRELYRLVSDVLNSFLGSRLCIILGGDKQISSHSSNHDEKDGDNKSRKECRIEWETPDDMHL